MYLTKYTCACTVLYNYKHHVSTCTCSLTNVYNNNCSLFSVCGFEAFINGKHIIGEVKEKEQAHREYKQAISEGHGAYLMDEETPVIIIIIIIIHNA